MFKIKKNITYGDDSLLSGAPRGIYDDGNRRIVSTTDSRGEMSFKMTSYPTPVIQTLTYLGANASSVGHAAKENMISVECIANSLTPAAVTCIIRVVYITHSDEGFYRLVLSNSLGELPFIFSVQCKFIILQQSFTYFYYNDIRFELMYT